MKRSYLLLSLILFVGISVGYASNNQQKILKGKDATALVNQSKCVVINAPSKVPSFVEFTGSLTKDKAIDALKPSFKFRAADALVFVKEEKDNLGMTNYKYQQYYNSVKVEDGIYNIHMKNASVLSANGFFIDNIKLNTQPVLSAQNAINAALKDIGATRYKWEVPEEEAMLKQITKNPNATNYPHPELLITATDANYSTGTICLAYKFDVYAHKPMSRFFVYVDAHTGKVIRKDNRICYANAAATGTTRYCGSKSFTTDDMGGGGTYRLRETGRGNGIETYNMLTGTNYGAAVDFTHVGNTWTGLNNLAMDDAALDAHWGAEGTYDYFNATFGRNSYDNAGAAIISYVHYDVAYDNAYWNGVCMTYGDGSNVPGGFTPLSSLDVCGHEITHAVTNYSANLNYSDESGGLNESFSDIFGTNVEYYMDPGNANFLIGDQVVFLGGALRDMQNPNAGGQPDTYLGLNWIVPVPPYNQGNDYGGVHTNSGVQNFWYYLVCNGGSGTNDIGSVYSVTGIGMTAAAAIAYRNLTVYLTSTSQYIDARTNSIQSAIDLYGAASAEEIAVTNAWYAVGVGAAYVPPGGNYVTAVAGSWDVTTNWTPNGRPTTGDNVTINHAMTIATPVNINNFILGAAGSVSVGTQTLTLNSTVTGLGGTITSSSTGTVTYNQASNGQNVLAGTYGNLTFSNFNKVLASSGNIDINNVFTPGTGPSHTITGSTIRYTNVSNIIQIVQPFHYNNITALNSVAPGYKNFVGSMQVDGVFTPPTNLQYCTGCTPSTIDFSGSGSQTIPAFYYNNLTSSSNGARTLASSGTIRIYSLFTPGSNTYTITGSTIAYYATVAQTIQPFSYNNLTVIGCGNGVFKTFSGVINVAGTFTPPVNNYRYSTFGNTINFNSASSQTIPGAFYYGTLSSSSTGARVLDPVNIIDVYTAFIPGTNTYTITNSTIRYAGSVTQTITAFTYNNLMSSGAGLRVWDNTNPVYIKRNFSTGGNNYTTTNGSTVVFNGSVAQTITGTCGWVNLTISNTSGGVSVVTGIQVLSGALTITTPVTFATGSTSFTLQSSATSTARIAVIPAGAAITGTNFVVQRYVSSRVTNYANLSSPVQSSTIADWDTKPNGTNEIFMYGVGGPDANIFGLNNTVFKWSEPTAALVPVVAQAMPLTPGLGFEVYLDASIQRLSFRTFDTRGTPNQGTQVVGGLSYTGNGYNLIGNPFASFISWNSVYTNSTNIDNSYRIFDAAAGNYLTYGAGTEIPSSQGFYVHATATPTVSILESAKTTTVTSVFHKTEEQDNFLTFKVSKSDQSISYYNVSKIDLNNDSQENYDNGDLPYMESPIKEAPYISTVSTDGMELCLNKLNSNPSSVTVPVYVGVGISGNYTIDITGMENVKEYSCVILEDKVASKFVDLRHNANYSFDINASDDKDRFVLHLNKSNDCVMAIKKSDTQTIAQENIFITKTVDGNLVNVDFSFTQNVTIKVINVLGQDIVSTIETSTKKESILVALPKEFVGVYYVTVIANNKVITKKFIN